jgi:hypothetical protein
MKDGPWYAGRVVHHRGPHALADFLALEEQGGWVAIETPHRLFPKHGQVEVQAVGASTFRPNDCVSFQVVQNTKRGATAFKASLYSPLPRFADLKSLGSAEAAMGIFASSGWASNSQPGQWAIRIDDATVVLLNLASDHGERLRMHRAGSSRVICYKYEESRVMQGLVFAGDDALYDMRGSYSSIGTLDWSEESDFVARIIRSLMGAGDSRLQEIIEWLELYSDDVSGSVSAIGGDISRGFSALRSGAVSARLSTDKALMDAYLAAVRDDDKITELIRTAVFDAELAARSASDEAIQLAAENSIRALRESDALDLEKKRHAFETRMDDEYRERTEEIEAKISEKFAQRMDEVETAAKGRDQELAQIRDRLTHECDDLRTSKRELESGISLLNERRLSEQRLLVEAAMASASLHAPPQGDVANAHLSLSPSTVEQGRTFLLSGLDGEVSQSRLLTPVGKSSLSRLVALMLAGEIPVLHGSGVDDFVLVAASIISPGRFVVCNLDATVLTADDLWSRPGSIVRSPLAYASSLASQESLTYVVLLRGIERSAASVWHESLSTAARSGWLPRHLLILSSVLDITSAEVGAIPQSTCFLNIEDAIAEGAAQVAPVLMSVARNEYSGGLNPGVRPTDLSSSLTDLVGIESISTVSLTLRMARLIVESLGISRAAADALIADGNAVFQRPR